MTATSLAPAIGRKSLSNTYQYAGGTITIMLDGADTGGAFSVWEAEQKPGSEPPLHVHLGSDETFFIVEGKMQFQVGDQVYDAVPGDYVFAPRGIPHTFRIQSPVVRAITVCTPAGFEDWFRELGTPATSFDLPDTVEPPSEAERAKMQVLAKQLGVQIVAQ